VGLDVKVRSARDNRLSQKVIHELNDGGVPPVFQEIAVGCTGRHIAQVKEQRAFVVLLVVPLI
jgi:hypothetical protein